MATGKYINAELMILNVDRRNDTSGSRFRPALPVPGIPLR